MPKVSLLRDQIADGSLPSVCFICGREAWDLRFSDLATWRPGVRALPGSPIASLLSFWGHILKSSRSGEESPGGLPFCKRHRSYWVRRAWFIIGGWVFLVASMAISILLTTMMKPDQRPHWTFIVAICWLLFFLPAFLMVHLASTRAIASDLESITLAGASRGFVSAFKEQEGRA
jgi:hypothetical protein